MTMCYKIKEAVNQEKSRITAFVSDSVTYLY